MSNDEIGRAWLAAFNARDLDALVGLYADDCTHTSPKLRVQRPDSGGAIRGKPALRYEELTVTANDARVILEYLRVAPGEPSYPVAEAFDLRDGKIVASRVYHG